MPTFDRDLIESIERCLLFFGEISGTDTDDRIYDNLTDMWDFELGNNSTGSTWYSKAYDYWESEENCPVTDDGVLGGYGHVTDADVKDSNAFLDEILASSNLKSFEKVADCGAGIGRVSKHLLLPRCANVDLVEQSPRLLQASAEYIGPDSSRTSCICTNLRDFTPEPDTYDLIWVQWVVGHLHDEDFILFFRNCARGLKPNGVIVLKDNCADDWTFVVDKTDSSVSRSSEYMKILFDFAGLKIALAKKQTDFPTELSSVYMFALVPNDTGHK
mmetsp:Transcript_4065/g.6298  ORF Transcript_4065/g.6298 Transcript_4065/m.6298 type:complete len:273 (-) Transcript_4065:121-939(-)|eukprot:CAMPEP_0185040272 /NCGR_PEP_ID=MMETSP1103-20130426/38127_1 /TAXON_ID=36769 /ORGANISM="Paraphysomonas bandaiensis, Strain Caron Lab Isolate" /LENGTH=272 /DNA_ID=CAMNT_0027579493 /DNA_START=11 /DNA_END=829 /DNA_ORIENTATION=-